MRRGLSAAVIWIHALSAAYAADPVNLSGIGAQHAHATFSAATARATDVASNAPGNSVFVGTVGSVQSGTGSAMGAGAGNAARLTPEFLVLSAHAAAGVGRHDEGGTIHAWGVGVGDPAPDPSTDPTIDSDLEDIFKETLVIEDVSPEDSRLVDNFADYDRYVRAVAESISIGITSLVRADIVANIRFNEQNDTFDISFDPTVSHFRFRSLDELSLYSVSLRIDSEVPDPATIGMSLGRAWVLDENGFNADLSQGWQADDLTTRMDEDDVLHVEGFSGLDFSVPAMGSDLDSAGFKLTAITTAIPIPEPTAMFLAAMGLLPWLIRRSAPVLRGRLSQRA